MGSSDGYLTLLDPRTGYKPEQVATVGAGSLGMPQPASRCCHWHMRTLSPVLLPLSDSLSGCHGDSCAWCARALRRARAA